MSRRPDLKGRERNQWLGRKPTEVEIDRGRQKENADGEELNQWKYQRYMQDYLACIQSVDDNVGRLLDWLDANGLRENTLVIYTSDQGFFLGDHGLYDKRFMYEPSLKMPFLVRWPGVIKPGTRSGRHGHQSPTSRRRSWSWPACAVPADMQGRSLVPLLKGEAPGGLAHQHVLPLLPRPRRSQHARPLRRAHATRTS